MFLKFLKNVYVLLTLQSSSTQFNIIYSHLTNQKIVSNQPWIFQLAKIMLTKSLKRESLCYGIHFMSNKFLLVEEVNKISNWLLWRHCIISMHKMDRPEKKHASLDHWLTYRLSSTKWFNSTQPNMNTQQILERPLSIRFEKYSKINL